MPVQDEDFVYTVVTNPEEQYSIWPTFKEVPPGWKEVGFVGSKTLCLQHISEVWKDMRPLSLRRKMEERSEPSAKAIKSLLDAPLNPRPQNSVITFLSQGWHPVSCAHIYPSSLALKKAIASRYVHITFTNTAGQTSLCLDVDTHQTDVSEADFVTNTGVASIVGSLILDNVNVRCLVKLNLPALEGHGTLVINENT